MTERDFWKNLPKPITVMAPMSGVTDPTFRFMVAKYSKYDGRDIGSYENLKKEKTEIKPTGGPDVIYTEFVSADGLFMGDKQALLSDMRYTEAERPIVAQFFSSDPDRMKKASELAAKMGFDGIDINLGCPDRSVCKQGAGSELIRRPKLACKIVKAVKEGSGGLPVSVKTRAGYYSDDELNDWVEALLETEPSALTLHARTRKDLYTKPARWELVGRAVEIRDRLKSETLIIGNGDIVSLDYLYNKVKNFGADGGMVGRALLGTPWFFGSDGKFTKPEERLNVLIEHCRLFESVSGDSKSFAFMKKHFKPYVSGWDGARELRTALMEADSLKEVEKLVNGFLKR